MDVDRIKGWQSIPVTALLIGLILRWIHLDEHAILLNTGFICFGVVAFMDGIKRKYYRQLNFNTLKILLPLVIMLLAIDNLVTANSGYSLMGIAILMLSGLNQGRRLILKRQV